MEAGIYQTFSDKYLKKQINFKFNLNIEMLQHEK